MSNESIMPVSTQRIVFEQFSETGNRLVEPGKQLNQMFFNMMLKTMFDTSGAAVGSSTSTQLNQQIYLNALTQKLSEDFDMGFTKLQFEIEQQESKYNGY